MSVLFQGRKVLIATMHGKEKVLAPILEQVGLIPILSSGFDTDRFGTFSGEVERDGNPIEVLRKKCIEARKLFGNDVVVASEGSFGPHPYLYFVPADDELILLMDFRNDLEIVVRELSTSTNFSHAIATSEKDLLEFSERIGFPDHAIILRSEKSEPVKGINHQDELLRTFRSLIGSGAECIRIETDMRAMCNPTRMSVIKKAAEQLKLAIMSECPVCRTPGFIVKRTVPGLPCEQCGLPTSSVKLEVCECSKCGNEEERLIERRCEDPMYCNFCNP